VVEEGARLFQASADAAFEAGGSAADQLDRLIAGHIAVVVDSPDVVRTYLNEARMLDPEHRSRVIGARDAYERIFRQVIEKGRSDGSFRADADPKLHSIFILSILNAIERWYRPEGAVRPGELAQELNDFVLGSLRR
jgi:hypothetical protein